jgi:phage shock protein PspC (stress-responsive transcriptional regulator)
MITGVAGGLGQYFGIDAVIFRVLFAVLTFFAGIGLLIYLVCWLLIPEPNVQTSALDRGIEQLRLRKTPPWLVISAAALALWAFWFSWWSPGPTFPALALIAIVLIVLVHRNGVSAGKKTSGAPAHAPYPWETPVEQSSDTVNLFKQDAAPDAATAAMPPAVPADGGAAAPSFTEPLVAPLNDYGRTMRNWYTESQKARRERLARRRPIKLAVAAVLFGGWAIFGIIDAITGIPFAAYIWFALGVLTLGLIASLVTRRSVWSLVGPIALLCVPALVFGGSHASLKDGSGKVGSAPTSIAELSDQHLFAGDLTLDLTNLPAATSDRSVKITEGAGRVLIRVRQNANVLVAARVHIGDIQLGSSQAVGDRVGGMNTRLDIAPTSTATGSRLTVIVDLTVGHIQVDRVP